MIVFIYLLIYTYLLTYIIKIKVNWVMNLKETEWYIWEGLAGGIKREVNYIKISKDKKYSLNI